MLKVSLFLCIFLTTGTWAMADPILEEGDVPGRVIMNPVFKQSPEAVIDQLLKEMPADLLKQPQHQGPKIKSYDEYLKLPADFLRDQVDLNRTHRGA